MIAGTSVGWCGKCNSAVLAIDSTTARCGCGATYWTCRWLRERAPQRPNLRLVKDEGRA